MTSSADGLGETGEAISLQAFLVVEGDVRHALAQTVERNVRGNSVEPAARGFGVAKCFPVAMRAKKCLFRQILRFTRIPDEPKQITVNSIAVRLEERLGVNHFFVDTIFLYIFLDWHGLLMTPGPPESSDRQHRPP